MGADRIAVRGLLRRVPLLALAAAGIVTIVGSGGGDGGCIPFDAPCPGGPGYPIPTVPLPGVEVVPSRATTTVGGSVVFKAVPSDASEPTYQWCRIPAAGGNCETIPGATGESFAVAGVNLSDDGARYSVRMTSGGVPAAATATLAVSSMPGVAFEDGDFLPADWTASAIVSPASGGPTYDIVRVAGGGNPDAFVSVEYSMPPQGTSSVRVLHVSLLAVWDPAAQGPIYTIDFTEDCRGGTGVNQAYTAPMIRQAGRTYIASTQERECASSTWASAAVRPSLVASNFFRIDGPTCGAGESCPDFSAAGAPIQLGLVSGARVGSGNPAGNAAHGFDNWRATLWRR